MWCTQLVIGKLQAWLAIIRIVALCWSYIHHLIFEVHMMIIADGMPIILMVSYIWTLFSFFAIFMNLLLNILLDLVWLVLRRCCIKNATPGVSLFYVMWLFKEFCSLLKLAFFQSSLMQNHGGGVQFFIYFLFGANIWLLGLVLKYVNVESIIYYCFLCWHQFMLICMSQWVQFVAN
jgi:hypothetical protein